MYRIHTRLTRMFIVLVVLFLGLGLIGLIAPAEQAQAQPDLDLPEAPDAGTWTTDEPVNSLATDGNVTYIGGYFDRVGPNTGCGVVFDLPNSVPDSPFPRINDSVYTSVADGSGGFYIGGSFTGAGGLERNGLAHLLADGSVDPGWKPKVEDGTVEAMALGDGVLYIGGYFNVVNGESRYGLAALDAATGNVTDWNPDPNSEVRSVAVEGDTVYVGGYFSNIGGQDRYGLAAIDATTGLATAWNPNSNSTVYDIAISGTTIYAGGSFTNIGGENRQYLAAVNATTGLATAWDPNSNSTVYDIAISGTTIYAGGSFTNIGGENRQYLAAVNATTGLATAWDPSSDSTVDSLALSGDAVYVGGSFGNIGGQSRQHLAAIDPTTSLATEWDPNPDSSINTLTAQGDSLFAGGSFIIMGGVERDGLAALDASGMPTAWDPECNGSVQALEYANGLVYVGGGFDWIGGENRECLAALDPVTGEATEWAPDADDYVNSIVASGSTVYAAGEFTNIGGQPRDYLAALDQVTGEATGWNPNPNNIVYDLSASNDLLYAAGEFTNIGGQPRDYLAALDPGTGLAAAWNPSPDEIVTKVLFDNGLLYVGGFFTSIGGESRSCMATLDAGTGLATSWNPGGDYMTMAFALRGGLTYAGGAFTYTGGNTRNGLAAIDAAGNSNTWNPNHNLMYYRFVSATSTDAAGGVIKADGTNQNLKKRDALQERLAAGRNDADVRTYDKGYYYGYIADMLFSGNTLWAAGYMWSMGYYSTGGLAAFTDPALDWYMAEGATDGGMETWILVENPNDYDVKVDLNFDTEKGMVAPAELQNLTIPANSRSSFNAGAFVTSYHLSTHLVSRGGQVFCERAMYGGGRVWGSASDGTTAVNSAWYMPEGATDGGMKTWVTIQNPNSFAVNVDVSFLTGAGEYQPNEVQNYRIAPHQRASLDVAAYVTDFNVATQVLSRGGGVVCERSTYGPRDEGETVWATSSMGSKGPSNSWYLAEGATDEGRETWVLVENPFNQPVEADVKFLTSQGEVQGPQETIPAKTRRSYNAGEYVTSFDVATMITAGGGGVICERAMYGSGRSWATTSSGSGTTATIWNMAEGSTQGGMETWIVVLNPGDADTKIFLSFQTDEGLVEPAELQNLTLAAGSRFTLRVKDYVTSFDVSTRVEAASGVVCERSTYGPVGGEEAAGALGLWATSAEGFHCDGK